MSIPVINYTQASNNFIDNYMSKCSGSAVKVFIAISRKTIGWHKTSDRISYSQLIELTGLTTNTLKTAIKELIAFDLITQSESKFGYTYDLNISDIDTSISNIDTGVSKIDTAISNIDTTKETNNKDTKLKETIYISDFDLFWNEYPKKVDKKNCYEKFKKKYKAMPDIQTHIDIIKKWKQTTQWKDGFIPNSTTWLNQERWATPIIEAVRLTPEERKQQERQEMVKEIIRKAQEEQDEKD